MTTPTAMCSPQSISMAQNKEIMHQSRASSKTFVFLQAPASCSAARDTKQKRRRKRTRRITRGLRRPADRLSPDVCHNRQGLSEVMGVKLCALRAEPRLENVIGALTMTSTLFPPKMRFGVAASPLDTPAVALPPLRSTLCRNAAYYV
jgi:hypothetical protein